MIKQLIKIVDSDPIANYLIKALGLLFWICIVMGNVTMLKLSLIGLPFYFIYKVFQTCCKKDLKLKDVIIFALEGFMWPVLVFAKFLVKVVESSILDKTIISKEQFEEIGKEIGDE